MGFFKGSFAALGSFFKAPKFVTKLRRSKTEPTHKLKRALSNSSSRLSNTTLSERFAASPLKGDNTSPRISFGSPLSASSRISTQGYDLHDDFKDGANKDITRSKSLNTDIVEPWMIDFFSEKKYGSSDDIHKSSTELWVQSSDPIESNFSFPTPLRQEDDVCEQFKNALLEHLSLSDDEIEKYLEAEKDMRLFCNVFVDSHEFYKETLIQLWLARGFIEGEHKHDIGNLLFQTLLSSGYIIRTGKCFARKKDLYTANLEKLNNDHARHYCNEDDEHMSLVGDDIDETSFKALLEGVRNLKALLILCRNNGSNINEIPEEVFSMLKHMEVLHLSGAHIMELPSSIGELTELKYLDLSQTLIEVLPESIRHLSKLQTLKLNDCERLVRLPEATRELVSLEHLELDVLSQLAMMPKGMGALTKLETLSAFLIHKGDGRSIQELKNMNSLKGRFCLSNLDNVSSIDEAKEAALKEKKFIEDLELRWNNTDSNEARDKCDHDEGDILEQLEPNSNLKQLKISCYGGKKFPKWMSHHPSFEMLSAIILFKCDNAEVIPSFGLLPSLKYLSLIEMNNVKEIGLETQESDEVSSIAFPMLERLEIIGFPQLVSWKEANERDYPRLSKVIIERCPKLIKVPSSLVQLHNLKHLEMQHCSALATLLHMNLSTSLVTLIINECPLITKEYQECMTKDRIKHLQTVWIDQEEINAIDDEVSMYDAQ